MERKRVLWNCFEYFFPGAYGPLWQQLNCSRTACSFQCSASSGNHKKCEDKREKRPFVVSPFILYCTTAGSFPLSVVFLAVSVSRSADCEWSVLCLGDLEWNSVLVFFFLGAQIRGSLWPLEFKPVLCARSVLLAEIYTFSYCCH